MDAAFMVWTTRATLLLFLSAFGVRLGAAVVLQVDRDALASAHHEHACIARSLAEGRGFRFNFFGDFDHPLPTSQQAPLVPAALALCYLACGIETPAAFIAMIFLQCVISAATVCALAAFTSGVAPPAGRWTGVLVAVYPPLVVSPLHVQALVWNLFWLALLLLGFQRLRDYGGAKGRILFVMAATDGLLTDPILGVVVGSLLLLLVFDRGAGVSVLKQVRLAAVLSTAIVVGIAPWLIRCAAVHGRFVFIKDSFGYVFWQGNTLQSQGTDKLLVAPDAARRLSAALAPGAAAAASQRYRNESVCVNATLSDADLHELQALPSEIARMDWFGRRIRAELAAHPFHYFQMCGRRLGQWIWFDDTNPRSFLWHYRSSYLLVVAAALFSAPTVYRNRRQWASVLSSALALTAVHTLIITSARFRIPLEMLLLAPASLTVAYFCKSRRWISPISNVAGGDASQAA